MIEARNGVGNEDEHGVVQETKLGIRLGKNWAWGRVGNLARGWHDDGYEAGYGDAFGEGHEVEQGSGHGKLGIGIEMKRGMGLKMKLGIRLGRGIYVHAHLQPRSSATSPCITPALCPTTCPAHSQPNAQPYSMYIIVFSPTPSQFSSPGSSQRHTWSDDRT